MYYNFEWDSKKAKANLNKHKISFELAATIFHDPNALSVYDEEHSENEERWISLGISINGNLLVVVHTYKQLDDETALIRIISARKATKNENKQYQG
jgi:uncharacterized protein